MPSTLELAMEAARKTREFRAASVLDLPADAVESFTRAVISAAFAQGQPEEGDYEVIVRVDGATHRVKTVSVWDWFDDHEPADISRALACANAVQVALVERGMM